jgi:hypothetical protein
VVSVACIRLAAVLAVGRLWHNSWSEKREVKHNLSCVAAAFVHVHPEPSAPCIMRIVVAERVEVLPQVGLVQRSSGTATCSWARGAASPCVAATVVLCMA